MTKAKQSLVNDSVQLLLFDSIKRDLDERQTRRPGRMCVSAKLLAAVKVAIKDAPKSREQIADDMTDLTGRRVTVGMLNNWTATSHPHDIPAELLPSFCESTGDYRPIMVLTDTVGVYTVEPPDVIRAKIQKIDEQKKKLDREKHKFAALLFELEGCK